MRLVKIYTVLGRIAGETVRERERLIEKAVGVGWGVACFFPFFGCCLQTTWTFYFSLTYYVGCSIKNAVWLLTKKQNYFPSACFSADPLATNATSTNQATPTAPLPVYFTPPWLMSRKKQNAFFMFSLRSLQYPISQKRYRCF